MNQIKRLILGTALVGKPATIIRKLLFPGITEYWQLRYQMGGTSGQGSYNRLAEFKMEVLNPFIMDNGVESVIEFGCGDGNQLSLAHYPSYIGLDVSKKAIELCKNRFKEDPTKSFFLYDPFSFVDNHCLFCADLALSLEVIFHLVEDEVYAAYMTHLFNSARTFVIIYSSDYDEQTIMPHVRHRHFSAWVRSHYPNWSLIKKIKNRYPLKCDDGPVSVSDFFIFKKDSMGRAL